MYEPVHVAFYEDGTWCVIEEGTELEGCYTKSIYELTNDEVMKVRDQDCVRH